MTEIRKIYDPEIPVNIYELGLIYDVKVEKKDTAKIIMTLTSPNCPVAESLPQEVKDSAMQVEGIEEVDLDLVFDPPWDKIDDVRSCQIGVKFIMNAIIKLSDNAAKSN